MLMEKFWLDLPNYRLRRLPTQVRRRSDSSLQNKAIAILSVDQLCSCGRRDLVRNNGNNGNNQCWRVKHRQPKHTNIVTRYLLCKGSTAIQIINSDAAVQFS